MKKLARGSAIAIVSFFLTSVAYGDFSDRYSRSQGTALGNTETGRLSYEELGAASGAPVEADVAEIGKRELLITGEDNDPAFVRLAGAGYDLDVSLTTRFLGEDYDPTTIGNDVALILRQNDAVGTVFSKGAVQLDVFPDGRYRLIASPVDAYFGFGIVIIAEGDIGPAFLLTDADGDGVLEEEEPFDVRAVVSGDTFRWSMNRHLIGCYDLPSIDADVRRRPVSRKPHTIWIYSLPGV